MRYRWLVLVTLLTACGPDADQDGFHSFRDCDDNNPRAYPKLQEVCDGIDNDCDGQVDEDVAIVAYWDRDGDGFGDPEKARRVCAMPEDGVAQAGDCDDLDPNSNPSATEVCDKADNNCDGEIDEDVQQTYFQDNDGDGHGSGASTTAACIPPDGYAVADDDCDDSEALAWTDAPEACDGIDNDCDGQVDENLPLSRQWTDADGDGYGDPNSPILACGVGHGVSDNALDCDDSDASVNLDTLEVDGNGLDDDCDGYVDEFSIPGTYATVEDAVLAAPEGSVVQLDAGTFVTTVDLTGRDLIFAGEGCDRTLLYGDGQGTTLTMDAGTVEGLTIAGGFAESGGGLVVRGQVTAQNICITGNHANDTGGGVSVESGSLHLIDATLHDNSGYDGGAIFVDLGAHLTLQRGRFFNNVATDDGGAINVRGGSVEVYSSTFYNNQAGDEGGAVSLQPYTDPVTSERSPPEGLVENATFVDNYAGDYGHSFHNREGEARLVNVLVTDHVSGMAIATADFGVNTIQHLGVYGINGSELRYHYVPDAVRGLPGYVRHDPAFPLAAQDFHLIRDSTFIDAGDPSILDPDGSPSDIGAHGGTYAAPDFADSYRLDSDLDGMTDGWEIHYGTALWQADNADDPDNDGLTNEDEESFSTDPFTSDTDADGVKDGDEVLAKTDPGDPRDNAPLALAEEPKWSVVSIPVSLSGALSRDPNMKSLTFLWSLKGPAGSNLATVDDPSAEVATFTPDAPGRYDLELAVSNGTVTRTTSSYVEAVEGTHVPTDVATIAEAVASVAFGGTVVLEPGTYSEVLNLEGKDIRIVGNGSRDEIVIDGGLQSTVIMAAAEEDLTLANLTISGGNGLDGGGLHLANGAILSAHNVRFTQNTASQHGGAIYAYRAEVHLQQCAIDNNQSISSGGGVYGERITLTLERSRLTGNRADQSGGALYLWSNETKRWESNGNLFANNSANRGGAIEQYGVNTDHYLTNNTFVGNVTDNRGLGTYYLRSGEAILRNNVFVDNDANPLLANDYGNYFPLNNTSWSNSSDDFGDPSQPVGYPLTVDPKPLLFIDDGDPSNDHWGLRPESTLIDSGLPDLFDLDTSIVDRGLSGGETAAPVYRLALLDADLDGMADGWEHLFGLDLSFNDAAGDLDVDGLDNLSEYLNGCRPDRADTDSDGVDDAEELSVGTNPTNPSDNRPSANAGDDLRVEVGETATLNGSASSDPNGDPLTYAWTLERVPSGSTLLQTDLIASDSSMPSFTPDTRGFYELTLVVSDGQADSLADHIRVEAFGDLRVPDDYPTIEDALAEAINNDTIVLDSGTHSLNAENIGINITIRGAGKELTQVVGAGGLPIITVTSGEQIILEDLTLSGANGSAGGAVECSSSSLEMSRVNLSNNASYYGGAISVSDCDTMLTDVHIRDNGSTGSGGAVYVNGGQFTWRGGSAERNTSGSLGGALYLTNGDYVVENVVFRHNYTASTGSAVHLSDGNLELHHNHFVENLDLYGAIFLTGGNALMSHNLFVKNSGVGIYVSGAIPVGNLISADYNGFYRNAAGRVTPSSYEANSVLGDPLFVDYHSQSALDDFRLRDGSPMIDAGSPQCTDPDGTVCDLGAFSGPYAPANFNEWILDSDSDGMSDGWEATHGFDITVDDSADDADGDGLSNGEEYLLGTDPTQVDSDGDGTSDGDEDLIGSDPLDPSDDRPTAEAGSDQTGDIGDLVSVDASASSDPNGDALTYSWRFVATPGRSTLTDGDLSDSQAELVSFTPDSPGTYVLGLTVNDGVATSPEDTVNIVITGDLMVPEDYDTLLEAIEGIHSGYAIDVAAGTFEVSADLHGKDVTIRGAGPDLTYLSGGGATIILQAVSGETLQIADMSLIDGLSTRGGAIEVLGGTLAADNVRFVGNDAVYGGAIYADLAAVELTMTRFELNSASKEGGALYVNESVLTAIQLSALGNESQLYGGALTLNSSSAEISNAVFSDNWALQGGAIRLTGTSLDYSDLTLDFSTLTLNESSSSGSVIRMGYGNASINNSIIAYNGPSYAVSQTASSAAVYSQSYTLFYGNDPGTYSNILPTPSGGSNGDIEADPDFLALSSDGDWTNDDWGLTSISPAVDAGNPASADTDGTRADMGAFGGSEGNWSP